MVGKSGILNRAVLLWAPLLHASNSRARAGVTFLPFQIVRTTPWKVKRDQPIALFHRGGSLDDASVEAIDEPFPEINDTRTEMEATESVTTTIAAAHNETPIVHNYTFGASKPGDGSESNKDGIPNRFLLMQKNNRCAAKRAFSDHLAWREEHSVDDILNRPHPKFDACKAVLPHYFPGRDVAENPVFVQRPGMIDMELAKKNNVTMEELLTHYVYIIEYCWNIFEPRTEPHDGVMTSIIDLTGVGWKVLKDKKILGFVKRFVKMMSENYPQRSYRTLIINSPKWFGSLYKLFKPMLRESTKKKIEIHTKGNKQNEALQKFLGNDSIPKELLYETPDQQANTDNLMSSVTLVSASHTHSEPGPNSAVEQDLRSFCMRGIKAAGMDMQDVVLV